MKASPKQWPIHGWRRNFLTGRHHLAIIGKRYIMNGQPLGGRTTLPLWGVRLCDFFGVPVHLHQAPRMPSLTDGMTLTRPEDDPCGQRRLNVRLHER